MTKVLAGIKVVEQGTFITGPAAGMLLGDLGADVVKVELPGTGDPFRAFKGGLYSPHYQTYNRNKRSITLDTKKADRPGGVRRADRRTPTSTSRTSAPASPRSSAPARSGCARSTRGSSTARSAASAPSGPAARPAGLRHGGAGGERLPAAAGQPREPARRRPGDRRCADRLLRRLRRSWARCSSAAARASARTVEVSMLEAMAHFNLDAFTHFFQVDEVMGPYSRPRVSQSYVLECADGKWIALHMSSPEKFWQGLAHGDRAARPVRRPALRRPREARIEHQEALIALLGERFKRRPRAEWCERLQRRGRAARPDVRHQRGARRSAGQAPAAHRRRPSIR